MPIVGATGILLDEDTMSSDSALKGATQQSVKAYTDAHGIVQIVNVQDGVKQYHTGVALIPLDDTIPQSTEGVEVMTLAITPTATTNKLKIEVVACLDSTGGNRSLVLFKDSDTDALACVANNAAGAVLETQTMTHFMTAGTTSEITFKVRVGGSGTTITFNGENNDSARFGGTLASSITITEIN